MSCRRFGSTSRGIDNVPPSPFVYECSVTDCYGRSEVEWAGGLRVCIAVTDSGSQIEVQKVSEDFQAARE